MSIFTDLVTTPELINYRTNTKNGVQPKTLSGLFPARKLPNNKLITAVNKNFRPIIAHVHAANSEAERVSYNDEVQTGELFGYRQKHVFDADDIVDLAVAKGQDKDFLLRGIYDYSVILTQAVEDAVELSRVQAIMKGKLTQKDADGNAYNFDYNIDKNQKLKAANFADPETDPIQFFLDAKRNANFAITRGIIDDESFYTMLGNKNVVQRVYGINSTVQSVMEGDLRNYFASQGLPTLLVYSDSYDDIDKKGNVTTSKYVEKGSLALFGEGTLGETIYGLTPEETTQIIEGNVSRGQVGNVMLSSFGKQDPVENSILASASATVTLAQRYSLLQGTVL